MGNRYLSVTYSHRTHSQHRSFGSSSQRVHLQGTYIVRLSSMFVRTMIANLHMMYTGGLGMNPGYSTNDGRLTSSMPGAATPAVNPQGMMPWFNMFNGTNQSSWGMPFGQGRFFNRNLGLAGMGGMGMTGMVNVNPMNMNGMGNMPIANTSMMAQNGQAVPTHYPNLLPKGQRSTFHSNRGSSGATRTWSSTRRQHHNSAVINLTPQEDDFSVTHKNNGYMQQDRSSTSTTSFAPNPFEVPTSNNPRQTSTASDTSDFAGSVGPLGSPQVGHTSLRGGPSTGRPS